MLHLHKKLFKLSAYASGFSVVFVTLCCLGVVFYSGAHSMNIDFLTSPAVGAGVDGGILYQILGTVILIVTAAVFTTPLGYGVAIYQSCYNRSPVTSRILSNAMDILNATPSVVLGIIGYVVFIKWLDLGKSWLTGALVLSLMILPLVTSSIYQRIMTIPSDYIESAKALGIAKDKILKSVILPYSFGGYITGLSLGLARAAGETAPIMFTAAVFSGADVPTGIKDSPVVALPYHIFNLAQDTFDPKASHNAWASASTLIFIVFIFLALSAIVRSKTHEQASHG